MISIVPATPSATAVKDPMEIPTLQAAADCVTWKKLFPMEIDAVLVWAVGFARANQETCVLPVPVVAEETDSQSALDTACHVQAVVKLKVLAPPAAAIVPDVGESW